VDAWLGQGAVRGVVASGFASSLGVYGFAVFLAADLSAGAWCRCVLGACRVEQVHGVVQVLEEGCGVFVDAGQGCAGTLVAYSVEVADVAAGYLDRIGNGAFVGEADQVVEFAGDQMCSCCEFRHQPAQIVITHRGDEVISPSSMRTQP